MNLPKSTRSTWATHRPLQSFQSVRALLLRPSEDLVLELASQILTKIPSQKLLAADLLQRVRHEREAKVDQEFCMRLKTKSLDLPWRPPRTLLPTTRWTVWRRNQLELSYEVFEELSILPCTTHQSTTAHLRRSCSCRGFMDIAELTRDETCGFFPLASFCIMLPPSPFSTIVKRKINVITPDTLKTLCGMKLSVKSLIFIKYHVKFNVFFIFQIIFSVIEMWWALIARL